MSNDALGLDVTDLRRSYPGQPSSAPALDGVSCTVAGGRTLAVLGPSGCGKSTLLRLLAGLEVPEAGSVVLGGQELSGPGWAVEPDRRDVNMVFQSYALWPHLTVRDNIGYGLRHGRHRLPASHRAERVGELLRLLRLDGLAGRRPAELSGGQQQRVAIARALATRPGLLLFDEPLSNLDVQLRTAMRTELAALLRSLDTTVVYVTHDVTEALSVADEILVLQAGRAVQHGAAATVFAEPASPWVAEMAGFSARLHLAEVEIGADGSAMAVLNSGVLRGRSRGVGTTTAAAAGLALVHPDAVRLVPDQPPGDARESDGSGDIVGLVTGCVFEGRGHRILAEIPDAGTVTVFAADPAEIGEKVTLRIEPDGVLVYPAAT